MLDITSAVINMNFNQRQTPKKRLYITEVQLKNADDADIHKESPDSHYFPYFFAYKLQQ